MKGLTINVGLTLHLFTPRTEKYDRQSNIDLSAINPANGLPGALVVAGQGGYRQRVPAGAGAPGAQPEHRLESAERPQDRGADVLLRAITRAFRSTPANSARKGSTQYATFLSPNAQLQPAMVMSTGVPAPPTPVPDLQPDAANNTIADLIDMSHPRAHLSIGVAVDRAGVPVHPP